MRRVTTALLLTTIVTGCTLPYRHPEIVGDATSVVGIKTVLAAAKDEVDVILVHGMCTHDKKWVIRANNNLAEALGSATRLDDETLPTPIVIDGETQIFHHEIEVDGKMVATHAVVWSPLTTPDKKGLCYDRDDDRTKLDAKYCESEPIENEYTRASVNRLLKNKILNDCLSDALAYVGPKKDRIQGQMQRAIELSTGYRASSRTVEALRAKAATEETPLFLVTESLGSKIFFDSLLLMVCKDPKLVAQTVRRTAQFFMAANQIPILSLAAPLLTTPACPEIEATGTQADGSPVDPEDSLSRLIELFGPGQRQFMQRLLPARKPIVDRLEVVAFTDPNDLLSYPLTHSRQARGAKYRSVDVIVSNAYTWIGALENPLKAHQDYLFKPKVRSVIACGLPLKDSC